MADRVIQRNDTAARWQSINPVLATGEIGIEIDGAKGYKIGDGKTRWNDLPYPANPTNVVQELGNNENAVMSQKAVSAKLSELGSKLYASDITLYEGSKTFPSSESYPQFNFSMEAEPGTDVIITLDCAYASMTYIYEISTTGSIIKQTAVPTANRYNFPYKLSSSYEGKIRVLLSKLTNDGTAKLNITKKGAKGDIDEIREEISATNTRIDNLGNRGDITYTFTERYQSYKLPTPILKGSYVSNQGVNLYLYGPSGNYVTIGTGETLQLQEDVITIKCDAIGVAKVEYYDLVGVVANSVDKLKKEIFGNIVYSGTKTFLTDNNYPQFNISIDASKGESISIVSDYMFTYVYELYSDGTLREVSVGENELELTLSDAFEGNLRVLYPKFTQTTNVTLEIYKEKGAISELSKEFDSLKESVEESTKGIDDDYPRMYSAMIFRRVGCIGDSYTAGHIQLNGGEVHASNPKFSYPFFMERLTGQIYSNFGLGGSTVKDWVTRGVFTEKGVNKSGNKCQAYIVGLGINDRSDWSSTATEAGTVSDIGTDNDTYIAYYYKLIQMIFEINPQAKIFCNTEPRYQNDAYNEAVRSVVSYCKANGQEVYLCDLAEYYNVGYYRNPIFLQDSVNGHFTAIGYQFMAECYIRIMSNVIKDNITSFQNVFEIPYDELVN